MRRSSRTSSSAGQSSGAARTPRSSAWIIGSLLALLLLAVGVASAFGADESQSVPPFLSSSTEEAAIESQLTEPKAAEELPHTNLERPEALELLTSVFEPELQSPAGIYDELEPERFISDYAAVIAAGQQPEPAGGATEIEASADAPAYEGPTLMESTLPLRTESPDGKEEAIDLSLEHAEGELKPNTPLVEVGIPGELGEGISLPESGITIELLGAPEGRVPSIIEGSAAAYPEVAQDTSLAVAPTPTGVETLTMMQSATSPREESFRLQLPAGAMLRASSIGGAEVVKASGEPLLIILPPSAIDANGTPVPVSLEVAGDSFKLTISPEVGAAFPILVDPIIQTYDWPSGGSSASMSDWHSGLWVP